MVEDQNEPVGKTGNIQTGDVKGSALVTGHHSTTTVTYTEGAPPSDDRAEVLEALRQIRAALETVSGPYSNPARRNADAAVEAASAESVDKDEIGGALESALDAAKKSAEFISVAAKIAPYLKIAVGWLGAGWVHLAGLLV